MSILEFRSSLNTSQREELRNVRELMDNFLNQFHDAIEENSQEPIDQLELIRMSMMDEIMRNIHTMTLYDFQAIEYLVLLFFTRIGENDSIDNSNDLLIIAENSFFKYCISPSSDDAGLTHKYRDLSLQSYYDLHNIAKEDCDAKFYFAVYTLCPLIMEYCRKEYIKLTTPTIKRIK